MDGCDLALISGPFHRLTKQIFHYRIPPDAGGPYRIVECSACHPVESNHDQAL